MNNDIIAGYKGVMPLDLRGTDPKYRKILIEQHHKDMEVYKLEESKIPVHLRYENTIERAMNLLQRDREMVKRVAEKK